MSTEQRFQLYQDLSDKRESQNSESRQWTSSHVWLTYEQTT